MGEGECFEYRVVANFGTYASRNTQAKWMHENCNSACCPGCAQSCPTDRNDCSNFYGESSCLRWGRAGECAANPTWMNENCSKECCPACRPEPAPLPPPGISNSLISSTMASVTLTPTVFTIPTAVKL